MQYPNLLYLAINLIFRLCWWHSFQNLVGLSCVIRCSFRILKIQLNHFSGLKSVISLTLFIFYVISYFYFYFISYSSEIFNNFCFGYKAC